MADTKFTPGPWSAKCTPGAGLSVHADVSKALGPSYSKDCPVYHLGRDSCGLQIAYELWTQFPRQEWDAMQQANAHLIAAAPELYEALAALDALRGPFLPSDAAVEVAWAKAGSALAKARGEQP